MTEISLAGGNITLIRGDCLEVMPKMKAGIIDLILADLPYGTTRNKWDSVLPLDVLWKEYKRLIKTNGAIVLTAQGIFAAELMHTGKDIFKYDAVWCKNNHTNQLNAKRQLLRKHENILVFSMGVETYNPQGLQLKGTVTKQGKKSSSNWGIQSRDDYIQEYTNYPTTLITIDGRKVGKRYHPTEKPVALMEYLIKTYTNEGDLVLDNTMGSGTTAVACINTGRRFVGIEKDTDDKGNSLGYFDICIKRCEEALALRT